MSDTINQFFAALTREEARFTSRFAEDRLGVDLRCALNELNLVHYQVTRSQELAYEGMEAYYILQVGITRLIYHSLTSLPSFDVPVVLFPRDPDLAYDVMETVTALGMIQHGRRVAQRVSMGTGAINVDENGVFTIELPSRLPNEAGHESEVRERLILEARERFAILLNTEEGVKLAEEVKHKLAELVYPWATHYIGYDADPLLDIFFFGLATRQTQMEEGYDSFHFATKFGGITYQAYVLALTFVIAHYLRHEAFAEVLVSKDRSIALENVLTITSDIDGFVADMREAVNFFGTDYESFEEIDLVQARTVFDVLSCGRHSVELVSAPGAPIPFIVQCSDEGFIHCHAGARSQPFRFLLESLRHHFPKDYDRNQGSRERSLQQAVRRILGKPFAGLDFRENIKAKVGGKLLTDIDLVVIEKQSGTILLCQLKHQDPYGTSIHAERTRGDRLVKETRTWLEAVQAWLGDIGAEGLRQTLRLDFRLQKDRIHTLVIARHFAHQLKDTASCHGALYATMTQLLAAATSVEPGGRPSELGALLDRLMEIPRFQAHYEHQPEIPTNWRIGELKFVTFQRT
jgi:hypothetical protein